MPKKRKYLVIHCTATQEGISKTPDDIIEMHLSPLPLAKGKVQYKGKVYNDRESLPSELLNGKSIKKLSGRGWTKVGYSKLVLLTGLVHGFVFENDDEFVDEFEITNGALGINSVAMHVCYVGGVDKKLEPKDTRTEQQRAALKRIILEIIYKWPDIKVAGHYHFAKKACPSFDVEKWLESIGVAEKNIYRKGK